MRTYSFDTSAFIEPWSRHYPLELFGPLWERLDELARDGIVVACEEVHYEIGKKTDSLASWFADRGHFFLEPTEPVQLAVKSILKSHPRLVSMAKNRSGADPWVIAQAQSINGAVVTYETWDPKRKNIKIPEVCHDLGLSCLTFIQFLQECGIKFGIQT